MQITYYEFSSDNWSRSKTGAVARCRCGATLFIDGEIRDDGTTSDFVFCGADGCDFGRYVRFLEWESDADAVAATEFAASRKPRRRVNVDPASAESDSDDPETLEDA
jgi:hypothetical protein